MCVLKCVTVSVIHANLGAAARLDVEESERQHLATEMELVLTYYCKTRNVPYTQDCGWAELLLPFVSLGLSRRDLFNAFYALTVKYLPRYVCVTQVCVCVHVGCGSVWFFIWVIVY